MISSLGSGETGQDGSRPVKCHQAIVPTFGDGACTMTPTKRPMAAPVKSEGTNSPGWPGVDEPCNNSTICNSHSSLNKTLLSTSLFSCEQVYQFISRNRQCSKATCRARHPEGQDGPQQAADRYTLPGMNDGSGWALPPKGRPFFLHKQGVNSTSKLVPGRVPENSQGKGPPH